MQKRIAAAGVILASAVLFASVFAAGLFTVAPAFEDLTDGMRETVMTDDAVAQARTGIGTLEAVSTEFDSVFVPTLADVLEMDETTTSAFLGERLPAMANGAAALPGVAAQLTEVIDLIDGQLANFRSADAIPTDTLSAETVPWGITIAAAIGLLAGLFMLLRSSRLAAVAAIIVGVLAVAGTLLLALVEKSSAADDMNEAFEPVLTRELVAQSAGALQVVGAMNEELQTTMVPAIAQQLDRTEAEMQGFIADRFPATAEALQQMPDAVGRFGAMVDVIDAQLDNYEIIKGTKLTPVAWTVVISGALMALFGLWAVLARKQVRVLTEETTSDRDLSEALA